MGLSNNAKKLKVWVIQTGEPLPIDGDGVRPMRAMNLCNSLKEAGHEVILWSSAFEHTNKRHRSKDFQSIEHEGITINLIPSPGYTSHKGLMRIFDHILLAYNFKKILNSSNLEIPQIAFVGFPPIELAYVAVRWFKKEGVPSVIDVKDQWPEAIIENTPLILPAIFKPILRALFFPYKYITIKTLKSATAFCSMSKSYLEWMSNLSNRALDDRDIIAPLTTAELRISSEDLLSAENWWEEKGVSLKTKRRMHFIGSLSPSFDFSMIKRVAERFEKKGINYQFVICGDGSELEKVRGMMSSLKNVIMPGWIDASKVKVLCDSSSASLAPYVNTDNFRMNVPNKILDSLQKGLPIITTLEGEVKELVEASNSGFSSINDDEIESCILSLLDDEDLRMAMSKNAKNLYSEKFSIHKVYNKLTSHLEDLAKDL